MKLLISWSGARSKYIAEALHEWLPNVIQSISPWMSASDIDKGARWSSDLASELEDTRFGLICLTSENVEAPWVLFEAGALSKTLQNTYVCPYLFGLEPTELKGPLVQFQAAKAQKEDTKKLIHTINQAMGDEQLTEVKINRSFELWWPELEEKLAKVPTSNEAQQPQRPEREILEEILNLVRDQTRASTSPSRPIETFRNNRATIQHEVLSLLKTRNTALTALEIASLIERSRPDTSRALRILCDEDYVTRSFDEEGAALYEINSN